MKVDISLVLVTIVLAILKLTGVVAWSWWIVTAPIWIPLLVLAVVVVFILILLGIKYLLD